MGAKGSAQSWARRILRVAAGVAILYVLSLVVLAMYQRRMLYYPTRMNPEVCAQIATREGFSAWRNPANEIIGWYWPARGSSHTGTVMIVHGNAGCAIDREYLANPISSAGAMDVFVLEYPGYGVRDGAPSQHSFLAAAEEGFCLLSNRAPIYVVSESLGTGVAAHLARTYPDRVRGICLFAPYDSLASVAQDKMPLVPVSLLLKDRFAPAAWLADYRGPAAFILAEADIVIPARFGERLQEGYAGPKYVQTIPGANHNEIAGQTVEWWQGIFSFWEQNGVRAGKE